MKTLRVLPLLASLLLVGCEAETNPSLLLVGFWGIDAENECTRRTDLYTSSNSFDAFASSELGQNFSLWLEIQNPMLSSKDDDSGRLNTTQVILEEVVIRFDNSGPWSFLPAEQKVETGHVVDSEGTLYQGLHAVDSSLAQLMVSGADGIESPIAVMGDSHPLRLTFQAKGRMMDGSKIESNELGYTLNVCNGCMGCPTPLVPANVCNFVQSDGFTCAEPELP